MIKKTFFSISILLFALILSACGHEQTVGSDRDEHGCIGSAGYQYCPSTEKCQRMWEEYCEEYKEAYRSEENSEDGISNFEECVAAGNPVHEIYPARCYVGEEVFIQEIDGDKSDLIILDSPRPEESVSSPLTISGQARGTWFFEASFPIVLTNWDGLIIAEGYATAQSDWMTEEFVPFEATLEFTPDTTVSNRGSLILQKDNPSGLPEYDDALEITVFFE